MKDFQVNENDLAFFKNTNPFMYVNNLHWTINKIAQKIFGILIFFFVIF